MKKCTKHPRRKAIARVEFADLAADEKKQVLVCAECSKTFLPHGVFYKSVIKSVPL